jgi:CheY-like chemotaxis protein
VVDDEPDVEVLFRQQFRHDLRAGRFTMEFAQFAPMALQRIADEGDRSLILILSDINMPGMSGVTSKDRRRSVVLLSGEAGIGKSRLAAALLEHLAAGEPHTRLRYFCSPQHTDGALYPVIGQMERAAGFVHDDTPQAKLDKLDAVLTHKGCHRSSRAIRDACRHAGTANAEEGTVAVRCSTPPWLSASTTAFVISSTNNGMPSVRSMMSWADVGWQRLVADDTLDHRENFAFSQPIDG